MTAPDAVPGYLALVSNSRPAPDGMTIKHIRATDTASWLTNRGWVTDSLDSRSEMARLGRPIPTEFIDTAPASPL